MLNMNNDALTDSFAVMKQVAQQGNASVQAALGLMYLQGIGVQQDYKQAKEWFEKAAKQDYAEAQFNLGVMYHNGDGMQKNHVKAKEWFEKAAKQGDASAQSIMEKAYAQSKED